MFLPASATATQKKTAADFFINEFYIHKLACNDSFVVVGCATKDNSKPFLKISNNYGRSFVDRQSADVRSGTVKNILILKNVIVFKIDFETYYLKR